MVIYPLIAWWIFPVRYVNVYQRVKPGKTTIFLWFSYGFPMVFLWFSYGFPMVFLWFSTTSTQPSPVGDPAAPPQCAPAALLSPEEAAARPGTRWRRPAEGWARRTKLHPAAMWGWDGMGFLDGGWRMGVFKDENWSKKIGGRFGDMCFRVRPGRLM